MAKYFELSNENQKVVVDDTYNVGKFLIKKTINMGNSPWIIQEDLSIWTYRMQYLYTQNGTTSGNTNGLLATFSTLREGGFDYDDTPENIAIVRANLVIYSQSNTAHRVFVYLKAPDSSDNYYRLIVGGGTDTANLNVTVAVYSFAKMVGNPKAGLLVYNAASELVFDVSKGYLQQIAVLNKAVNYTATIGSTYTVTVPTDLNSAYLFISNYSCRPSYAAYKISSHGVSFGSTNFNPIITIVNSTTIQVDFVRQRQVSGSNSAYGMPQCYENLIYCPYPENIYTGFNS